MRNTSSYIIDNDPGNDLEPLSGLTPENRFLLIKARMNINDKL
ncbi:MAG: hypothetical protein ACD_2C00143G0004 [uncultured bacterium (gcode 4)]|uniref:Uncharacterized protein n=1 Tax=uncultured bacterium (gcode 4) TaxID=1234023 RepID=K2FEH1_9BACT|nr:MAG: hypothetical protein ACD_2C00143G0004 [uncultured bacterium (gcode 4)]